jgi:hypothetical protein
MMEVTAPPVMLQTAIARAVHRAVVDLTRSNGYGACYLYALAGCELARDVLGRDYRLQAGLLRMLAHPPDGGLVLRPTQQGLLEGAYHCWFGRVGPAGEIAEVVDLASRHYRRWADSNRNVDPGARDPIRWSWPAGSPDHVWMTGKELAPWLGLVAEQNLTQSYIKHVAERQTEFQVLHRLARGYFDQGWLGWPN